MSEVELEDAKVEDTSSARYNISFLNNMIYIDGNLRVAIEHCMAEKHLWAGP
jgi:hypothetical protein